jgi:hypothetical protein
MSYQNSTPLPFPVGLRQWLAFTAFTAETVNPSSVEFAYLASSCPQDCSESNSQQPTKSKANNRSGTETMFLTLQTNLIRVRRERHMET